MKIPMWEITKELKKGNMYDLPEGMGFVSNTYGDKCWGEDVQFFMGRSQFRVFDKAGQPTFTNHATDPEKLREAAGELQLLLDTVDFERISEQYEIDQITINGKKHQLVEDEE